MTRHIENLGALADQYLGAYYALARDDFGLFRQLIRPDMLWGWWTDQVAGELQRFYFDLIAGKRPKLALMAPPQHGKSWTVWDFIAWIAQWRRGFSTGPTFGGLPGR